MFSHYNGSYAATYTKFGITDMNNYTNRNNQTSITDNIYKLNQEYIFTSNKGKYSLVINSIESIGLSEINKYSLKDTAKQAILIEYTYKNISYIEDVVIFDYKFQIVDEKGFSGNSTILGISSKYKDLHPQKIAIGVSCKANMVFEIDNISSNIKLYFKDDYYSNQTDAIFELSLQNTTSTISQSNFNYYSNTQYRTFTDITGATLTETSTNMYIYNYSTTEKSTTDCVKYGDYLEKDGFVLSDTELRNEAIGIYLIFTYTKGRDIFIVTQYTPSNHSTNHYISIQPPK